MKTISNETLKAGTLRATYSPATYRTEDGESYYKFRFVEKEDGKFDIDILELPSYKGRDENRNITHFMNSERGGYKISICCGYEPATLAAAKKLAKGWAELTNTYIKTGVTIDKQVSQNSMQSAQSENIDGNL